MSEQLRHLLDLPLFTSVDPVFGPVYQLFEISCPPEGFQVHTVVAKGPDVQDLMGLQFEVSGIGYHRNLAKAANMAVGECLERLALFPIDLPEQPESGYDSSIAQVGIESFIHNNEVRSLIDNEKYPGVEGVDLIQNMPAMIPLDVCCFGTSSSRGQVEPIPLCTSTGAAIHVSEEAALAAGLKELIERDLFMLTWYTHTRFPRACFDDDSKVGKYISEICSTGAPRPQIVDLSAPYGIPAAICLIFSDTSFRYGIGASVGVTMDDAAISAINEAAAVYNADPARYVSTPAQAAEIASFDDHVWWYQSGSGARSDFEWLVESGHRSEGPWPDFGGLSDSEFAARMIDALAGTGAQVFAVPLAKDFLGQLGLYAFHVLSPQTCDLDVYHRYPAIDNQRVRSAWARRFFDQPAELNLDPHPFP